MKRIGVYIGVAMMSLFMAFSVQATPVLDLGPGQDGEAFLHVGDPPNPPLSGSPTYLYYTGTEGHVTPLSGTNVSVMNNANASKKLTDPMWLILGVPNADSSYVAPVVTDVTLGTLMGGPQYAGFLGTKNTPSGPETYEKLYIDIFGINGDASQSFTNWNLVNDLINGFVANTYGIFVYKFDMMPGMLAEKSIMDITFGSSLDVGTYAMAVGKLENGKYATTPFTETGLSRKVPEPSSLLLMGIGLLGFGIFRRKK